MLIQEGFKVSLYDPFFYPSKDVLTNQYDFITCTETVEHFHDPYKEFNILDDLLKPGGWLGVMTSFFQTGDSKVELLESTTPDGPIARHIDKRGPGLHHVAFLVDDLEGEIARLEAEGYRVVSGPKPGADQKRIAFLHPSDTAKVLVELCEDI